jgi:hypothetical protein
MTMQGAQKRGLQASVVVATGVLGLFGGLCTLFALVVTTAQAWQERAEAGWPQTTAQVRQCSLEIYSHRHKLYWINCSIRYQVHGREVVSTVHSLSTPAPERVIWESSPGIFGNMQDWVDQHPEGSSIRVHYDPAHPEKAVQVETDMPRGGPQTQNNLKLLEFFAASFVVMVIVARMARPRRDAVSS